MKTMFREKAVGFFSLFTSTGTLLCCALPVALAAIAGGTAITSLISTLLWLILLSNYKEWLFLIAGILIALNAILTLKPQSKLACSITGSNSCRVAGRFSRIMFFISLSFYSTGFFFAYLITPLLRWLES